MDWMKLTVLTTTIASDIVSQTLIDARKRRYRDRG